MKLNPEALEIETFPTEQGNALSPVLNTDHPTPQTYCFVCD